MKTKFLIVVLLVSGYFSQAQIRYFYANLQGSQQVPVNASTATGIVLLSYDMSSKFFKLYGDYQGLGSNATVSHIHGPATPGSNASVVVALNNTGDIDGSLSGSSTLTATNETDLMAGNMYVNVHTTNLGGGEIRGQLMPADASKSFFLTGNLQGSQEVPVNASSASGKFYMLLDTAAGMVYVTGKFTGLAAAASMAHIHVATLHVNGGVIVTLMHSAGTSGTIHGMGTVNPANQLAMRSAGIYVNIHNATYPGGEIRGQATSPSSGVNATGTFVYGYSYFKASLKGSQQVPANASAAKGTVIVKYDNHSRVLELTGDYQNIDMNIAAAHIHSPAVAGANAGVIITLYNTGGTSGVVSASATLTAQQEVQLFSDSMYVNVHNATYAGGEIRGQLSGMSGYTELYTADMQGAQEVPANASAAAGTATVLLDNASEEVYVTGHFSGLSANASAGHLHRGLPDATGPVIVPLSVTASVTGTITGNTIVSTSFADSIEQEQTYINVHNSLYPGGEIRGLINRIRLFLPIKLTYFNGYKDRNNISLIWESAQETDLLNYEVEQQDPVTKNWITKTSVKAKGGNLNTKYNVSDVPVTGSISYVIYRLKMIDKNSSFTYSNAVRINFKKSAAELTLLSNPVVNGSVRYTITGLSSNKYAEVSVIDFNGRLMIKTIQPSLSTNEINLAGLATGMYKLVVKIDGVVLQKSFLK